MIHKIFRHFVNTLTVKDKFYLLNRDNLTQLIQMQLSQKQKAFFTFFFFFFAFLKYILNFQHLHKKDYPRRCCISGNTSSENYGEINVWKAVFQRTLRQTTQQMGQNTVAIWKTAPFRYLLITEKVVALEEVSFSDTHNPKTVC